MKGKHRTHLTSTYLDSLLSSILIDFSLLILTLTEMAQTNSFSKEAERPDQHTGAGTFKWILKTTEHQTLLATAVLVPEFGTWTPL